MAHKISSITQHNASSLQLHSPLLRDVLYHNYALGRGDKFFNGFNVLFIAELALWQMKPETEPGSRLQWLKLYSETQVHICLFKCTNLIQIALIHVNVLDCLNNFAWRLSELCCKGVFPLKPVWLVLSLPFNLFTNMVASPCHIKRVVSSHWTTERLRLCWQTLCWRGNRRLRG